MRRNEQTPSVSPTFTFTNDVGREFLVRLVRMGENYGNRFCLTHDHSEPMLEFYDTKYDFDHFGQFVSRYYVNTLMTGNLDRGLDLDGGVPVWKVDAKSMVKVRDWINEQLPNSQWKEYTYSVVL